LGVESDAIAKMTEMRDRGVLAFVGSGFDCASEALVADAWNMPMVAFVREFYSQHILFASNHMTAMLG